MSFVRGGGVRVSGQASHPSSSRLNTCPPSRRKRSSSRFVQDRWRPKNIGQDHTPRWCPGIGSHPVAVGSPYSATHVHSRVRCSEVSRSTVLPVNLELSTKCSRFVPTKIQLFLHHYFSSSTFNTVLFWHAPCCHSLRGDPNPEKFSIWRSGCPECDAMLPQKDAFLCGNAEFVASSH